LGEILRDPVWQFIGVILAVVISCVGYLIQRNRKKLVYEIVSRTRLVTKEEEIKGSLQIVFEGKPVEDVRLLEIKIINSGNMPIVSSDYERPVSLFLGDQARILTATVSETFPQSLQATVESKGQAVVLSPVLLNGGDSITLKMLISHLGRDIKVDSRIAGVKEIHESDRGRVRFIVLILMGLAFTGVGIFLLQRSFPVTTPDHDFVMRSWPAIFLIAIGYGFAVAGLFAHKGLLEAFRVLAKGIGRAGQ
jgi:hypothetical protein